jgi:hypothetical protein
LTLLALARDDLAERNSNIPVNLPAVWITLGQPARAAALVNGITDAHTRIQALTLMHTAAHNAGEHDLVPRIATDAERTAREITNPGWRTDALRDLARQVATDAERSAREIPDPERRAEALRSLADVLLEDLGQGPDRAGARRLVAEVLNSSYWRTVLGLVARLDAPALRTVCDVLLAGTATEAAKDLAP